MTVACQSIYTAAQKIYCLHPAFVSIPHNSGKTYQLAFEEVTLQLIKSICMD